MNQISSQVGPDDASLAGHAAAASADVESISGTDAGATVVGAIDMTPTWGECGLMFWRLARSGEMKACEAMKEDMQRAWAGMEVLRRLDLTPEQQATYHRVMAEELAKQNRY